MRILVVGAGAVGFHLAEKLSREGQDVVVVDSDPGRTEYTGAQLDVMTVTGNGASLPVLEEAGIKGTDLLLAVTSRDEVNLIACLAASRAGVDFRVARISNPEYYEGDAVLTRDQLGVDLMINPERECAWETFQLLNSEAATDLARFGGGRLQLVGPASHVVLVFLMLAGRLEIFTVLLLFHPELWRSDRSGAWGRIGRRRARREGRRRELRTPPPGSSAARRASA